MGRNIDVTKAQKWCGYNAVDRRNYNQNARGMLTSDGGLVIYAAIEIKYRPHSPFDNSTHDIITPAILGDPDPDRFKRSEQIRAAVSQREARHKIGASPKRKKHMGY